MARRRKTGTLSARLEGSVSSAGGFRAGRGRAESTVDQAAAAYAKVGALLADDIETLEQGAGDPGTAKTGTLDEHITKLANPVPGDDGEALARITASFAERFPKEWEEWRLCPLVHGLDAMAKLLKGKG